MPNLDLKGKYFGIKNDRIKKILDKDKISYEHLNKIKSELKNKKELNDDEKYLFNWITEFLNELTSSIERKKRLLYQSGGVGTKKGGNVYKDTHTKNKHNKNITKTNIPKITLKDIVECDDLFEKSKKLIILITEENL
jgi:aspartyl-tRNA synthetase